MLRNKKSKDQIADKLIVRTELHLEQQILIKIFLASIEMNPSALNGTCYDQDSLRGKTINQYKSIAVYFAASKFWNSFNCANLL